MIEVVEVSLEDDEWLEAWSVARAIAKALHPDPSLRRGSALIRNKVLTHEAGLALPFSLSDAERAQLDGLLDHLPPLHGGMSEEEKTAFIDAFRALPAALRPDWEPQIPSPADLYAMRIDHYEATSGHMAGLAKLVKDGLITAMNPNRTDPNFGPRTLLYRVDVVGKYMSPRFLRTSSGPFESSIAEGSEVPPSLSPKPAKQKKIWTPEFCNEVRLMVKKLGTIAAAAKELGVSPQNVSDRLLRDEEARTRAAGAETQAGLTSKHRPSAD